jgi:glycosyltransferase involved in cell wall biosynthesis
MNEQQEVTARQREDSKVSSDCLRPHSPLTTHHSPLFTCIVISHNKPAHVAEALDSLAQQTFDDWEAIVFDSGVLYDQGFFDTLPIRADRRFRLIRSWETDEIRRTKTIASWCSNECFRKGLVRGTYVTYLCDDDLLDPGAFDAFYRYLECHPDAMALYGAVDMTVVNERGERLLLREIPAKQIRGSVCGGGRLDQHVDYLQICHHVEVLKTFPSDEYWPEDRDAIRHADGIFLEQVGRHFPIYPVSARIGENRKVPASLNDGGERLRILEQTAREAESVRQLLRKMGPIGTLLNRLKIEEAARRTVERWPVLLGASRQAVRAMAFLSDVGSRGGRPRSAENATTNG